MRILVVSDTHRKNDIYLQLVKKHAPLDMVIHCGDIEGSESIISEAVECPVYMVSGNNDFFSKAPSELEFNIGKHRAFLTHGNNYYISMGTEILKDEAKSRKADMVFFGHTHRPVVERENGIIAINPGSLTYPRQEGKKASYIIMEEDKGEFDIVIYYLP